MLMRLVRASAVAMAVALLVPVGLSAQAAAPATPPAQAKPQGAPPAAGAMESDRKVAGGGITAKGWEGKVDANAAKQGGTINDSKFAEEGGAYHLTVGPAASYWSPSNKAAGDYTVKATFKEAKQTFSHPHPFGLFIGGSKLGTDQQSLMYCVAYRDGSYLVRSFKGDVVTTVAKKTPNDAVAKAAADAPVTQEIEWRVKGGRAECAVNGTVVAGFDKAEIVGDGKLESTDGVYGIRSAHNTDVVVSGLKMTKN
jgi:hypothetical protein